MKGKEYLNNQDRVAFAYELAKKLHQDQFRKSGELYFSHCEGVYKIILEEWGIKNEDILISALLHDSVEDGKISREEITKLFGENIAEIIDGVTKLKSDSDKQASQKVFDKSRLRPAVAFVKLADRLHNMRTQEYMDPDKRIKKSEETLNTYIPLAESLGMWEVKRELEDLCFFWYDQKSYQKIDKALKNDERHSEMFQSHIISRFNQTLSDNGYTPEIYIRNESLWFINQKLKRMKTNDIKEIDDIVSFRIIVPKEEDIYKTFYILDKKEGLKIDHGKCVRYLNENKQLNGYQAMQITINYDQGPVEIGIVTKEMEEFNNWGVVSLIRNGEEISNLKDYFLKPIYVHEKEVRFVHPDASILDIIKTREKFLYAESANINGEKVPLSTIPSSNATISINYKENPYNNDELKKMEPYCLPQTRKSIEEIQKINTKEEVINKGKEKIRKLLSSRGLLSLQYLEKLANEKYRKFIESFGGNKKDLYYYLGGDIDENKINETLDKCSITKENLKLTTIEITGKDEPHILVEILNKIKKTVVVGEELVNPDNTFYLCKVVKDLNPQEEEEIRNYLNSRFSSVLVV